jgi:general secretion pathway protein B
MSYILDALKKIEHEKRSKKLPDGRMNIAGELFHERKLPAGNRGMWKIVMLVVGVSLLVCTATWFVLKGKNKKGAAVSSVVVSPSPAPVIKPPAPPVIVPVQPQQAPVVPSPSVPAVRSLQAPPTETDEDEDHSARRARRANAPTKPRPTIPKTLVATVPVPADIKLSGIAWQDDRSSRRAVINGFLLKEGAVVSGAKITDIMADKVRFSTSAGVFELRLDGVVPTEVKK